MITDKWLDKITMYRLTLYYLLALTFIAAFLGVFNLIPFTPTDIGLSLLTAIVVAGVANSIFAKAFHAITNIESVFITALILVLIIPAQFPANLPFIALAAVLAMAAKYLLTIDKQHIFNPAAIAVFAIPFLFPNYNATWWIGAPLLMPFVAVGGFLLIRRIRREQMVAWYFVAYFAAAIASAFLRPDVIGTLIKTLQISVFSSPVWFLGMVMLTEPLTSPSNERMRNIYGVLVGFFAASTQLKPFGIVMTPETALAVGNIFTLAVNPWYRLVLPLKSTIRLTPDTFAFVYEKSRDFVFRPGQYLEWTLPHKKADERGNRRYFTIASSPTENELMIGVKYYNPLSSFKKALLKTGKGKEIIAAQLAGDFVLPKASSINKFPILCPLHPQLQPFLNQKSFNVRLVRLKIFFNQNARIWGVLNKIWGIYLWTRPKKPEPLVFIAGGIGITPFRSMIKYIIDKKIQSDIILLYSNKREEDIVFADVFEEARQFGVNTIYTLTDKEFVPQNWQGKVSYVDERMIDREVPDYLERKFYISGPQLMVQALEKTLGIMGVKKKKIVTDYFPGFGGK